MNILFTSVAISQLKCLDYAFFVAKMSKMTFTRFGGQVLLDGGQVRQFRGRAPARPLQTPPSHPQTPSRHYPDAPRQKHFYASEGMSAFEEETIPDLI